MKPSKMFRYHFGMLASMSSHSTPGGISAIRIIVTMKTIPSIHDVTTRVKVFVMDHFLLFLKAEKGIPTKNETETVQKVFFLIFFFI